MGITYFKSENVKVFPCAYRGQNGTTVFNPEARLNTEYNLTHTSTSFKDSYIVDWHPQGSTQSTTLCCVIGGYYFELSDVAMLDFVNSETKAPKYLVIKKYQVTFAGTTEKTWVLNALRDDSTYENLDVYISGEGSQAGYRFVGLGLADDIPTEAGSRYLQVAEYVGDTLKVKYDEFLPKIFAGTGTSLINNIPVSTSIHTYGNTASGANSAAFGVGTNANIDGVTVVGTYNDTAANGDLFIVGNGISTAPSNAFKVSDSKAEIFKPTTVTGNITLKKNNSLDTGLWFNVDDNIETGIWHKTEDDCLHMMVKDGNELAYNTAGLLSCAAIELYGSYAGNRFAIKPTSSADPEIVLNTDGTATFNGNVAVKNGLDITGAALTVGDVAKIHPGGVCEIKGLTICDPSGGIPTGAAYNTLKVGSYYGDDSRNEVLIGWAKQANSAGGKQKSYIDLYECDGEGYDHHPAVAIGPRDYTDLSGYMALYKESDFKTKGATPSIELNGSNGVIKANQLGIGANTTITSGSIFTTSGNFEALGTKTITFQNSYGSTIGGGLAMTNKIVDQWKTFRAYYGTVTLDSDNYKTIDISSLCSINTIVTAVATIKTSYTETATTRETTPLISWSGSNIKIGCATASSSNTIAASYIVFGY